MIVAAAANSFGAAPVAPAGTPNGAKWYNKTKNFTVDHQNDLTIERYVHAYATADRLVGGPPPPGAPIQQQHAQDSDRKPALQPGPTNPYGTYGEYTGKMNGAWDLEIFREPNLRL